jgi:hypothetical protein
MLLGKLDIHKTETRSLSFILYQNQLKDLNIRPETLKQFHEVVGNTMEHTGIGKTS